MTDVDGQLRLPLEMIWFDLLERKLELGLDVPPRHELCWTVVGPCAGTDWTVVEAADPPCLQL